MRYSRINTYTIHTYTYSAFCFHVHTNVHTQANTPARCSTAQSMDERSEPLSQTGTETHEEKQTSIMGSVSGQCASTQEGAGCARGREAVQGPARGRTTPEPCGTVRRTSHRLAPLSRQLAQATLGCVSTQISNARPLMGAAFARGNDAQRRASVLLAPRTTTVLCDRWEVNPALASRCGRDARPVSPWPRGWPRAVERA